LKPLGQVFGEAFVFDLLHSEPFGAKAALTSMAQFENLKVVVCGGDGTVQWVLSDIDILVNEGILKARPAVAVLPLGTGNDLSRQFGWGHGFTKSVFRELRPQVLISQTVLLDRWNIEIINSEGVSESKLYSTTMSNYFGIGLDAKVVGNFESCRFFHSTHMYNNTFFILIPLLCLSCILEKCIRHFSVVALLIT